jgi:hypothetical protein
MAHHASCSKNAGIVAALVVAIAVSAGCRFMPDGAYWIEAHGEARALNITARPAGAMVIGTDSTLWAYPGYFARPWVHQGPEDATAIAASARALYAVRGNRELFRVADGTWTAYQGSAAWGVTAISASEDDRLFAIAAGRIRRLEGRNLTDAPCADLPATFISSDGADGIYAVAANGILHHGSGPSCAPVTTPAPVREVAAFGGRVVVLTQDATLWRRRGDGNWHTLPRVRKYRPKVRPYWTTPVHLSLSAYSTWIVDNEQAVFLLSDET